MRQLRIASIAALIIALPALAQAQCPAPGSVRSVHSKKAATIHIANSSRWPLKIYWLDYSGERQFYRELKQGEDYRQKTFKTHPWIVVNPKGDCVDGVFKAEKAGDNLREIFGD